MNTGSPLTKWSPQGFLTFIWVLKCAGIIPSALHTLYYLFMQQAYNRDHCFQLTDEETEIKATKTYIPLLFKVRWKQLHEVIREHSSSAVELSFPPAYIDAILGNRRAENEKWGSMLQTDLTSLLERTEALSLRPLSMQQWLLRQSQRKPQSQMEEQKLKCARASGWDSKPTAAFRCPESKRSFFPL